jgi:hypothetical protein
MMQTTLLQGFVAFTSILTLAQAIPEPHSKISAKWPHMMSKGPKAIYMLSNDASNAVVAVPIGADGLLSMGTLTPTGGAGSNVIDGSTNTPAGPDALDGQSCLTIADNVRTA